LSEQGYAFRIYCKKVAAAIRITVTPIETSNIIFASLISIVILLGHREDNKEIKTYY